MTGGDGSPDPDAGPGWRWDVALSFASAQRSYVEILRARIEAGDDDIRMSALHVSAWRADLLARRGDLDGLQARADAGDGDGDARRLADLLIKQGRGEEAERLRRFGLNPDGSIALE